MTVSLDSLCGVTALPLGRQVFFVAQGLSSGQVCNIAYDDGPPFNTGNDVTVGSLTADASGNAALNFSSALTFSQPFYIHSTSAVTIATRLAGPYTVGWSGSGAQPAYGTAAVLNSAVGGNTTVDLSWTAAFGCDVRLVSISYQVARSSTGPTSGFANVGSPTSGTTFHDTGRTNGTTYWYRVSATITYVAGITIGGLVSNVVSAVPSASVEVWGSIPQ